MSNNELYRTLKEYKELKELEQDLKEQIKATEEVIKNQMDNLNEISAGGITAKLTSFEQIRTDSARLKKEQPKIYIKYSKTVVVNRFTVK